MLLLLYNIICDRLKIISGVNDLVMSVRITCVIHVISGMFQQQNLG